MIKITPLKNYCLLEPQGPLSKEDFSAISAQLDPIIESEGELEGLVIKTREFPGWEKFSDVIEHFRFVRNHHRAIRKIAIVTDAKVAEILPTVVNHFVKAEVKHFSFDEYRDAIEWID
jgi:hypothetical protein